MNGFFGIEHGFFGIFLDNFFSFFGTFFDDGLGFFVNQRFGRFNVDVVGVGICMDDVAESREVQGAARIDTGHHDGNFLELVLCTVAHVFEYHIAEYDSHAYCEDAADNVPGVKGIGEVWAGKLVSQYGSLEGIYANIDSLTRKQSDMFVASRPYIDLSKKLVTIKTDVPLKTDIAPTSPMATEIEFGEVAYTANTAVFAQGWAWSTYGFKMNGSVFEYFGASGSGTGSKLVGVEANCDYRITVTPTVSVRVFAAR